MKKILIIAPNEICHNPRLVKAGEFLERQGYLIVVFNPILGWAKNDTYPIFKQKKKWRIKELAMDRKTLRSDFNWLVTSGVQFISRLCWNKFRIKIGFRYYVSKSLVFANFAEPFDYILTNVVDCLPQAAYLAKKLGAKLIYDSQEFFTGQYMNHPSNMKEWVETAEQDYLPQASLITATTQAMVEAIRERYTPKVPLFRLRNVPFHSLTLHTELNLRPSKTVQMIWHGFAIFYRSRGIHVLIDALGKCTSDVHLTLQGDIFDSEKAFIQSILLEKGISARLTFRPPAEPDQIVASIVGFDIGLIGELPLEKNQELTSSNKLFDYIHAGLAVISPNLIGLMETMQEYPVGLVYKAGDSDELASCIDQLASDLAILNQSKQNSREVAKQLNWQMDYQPVFDHIQNVS